MPFRRHTARTVLTGLLCAVLAGCGGGGGDGPSTRFASSDTFADRCTVPEERSFVRSYLDEIYLWYDLIQDVDPEVYPSATAYFDALTLPPPTDRFSFHLTTAEADALATGTGRDYGVTWVRDSLNRWRVAKVAEGSPASEAGLARGGVFEALLSSSANGGNPELEDAFIRFRYADTPNATPREVTLFARVVSENPVPVSQILTTSGNKRLGYLAFHDFNLPAQDKLIDSLRSFSSAGVQHVVLDMRYNGGGYLYIANTLASMLTPASKDGQVSERLQPNDKLAAAYGNEFFQIGGLLQYSQPTDRYPKDTALPRLAGQTVYVLATSATCSASESVVNGLRGLGIPVVLVGNTTCGKPYGFRRRDNCGQAYYPIEFKGVNALGRADYTYGFAPTCSARDDLDRPLGDPAEGMLAVAMSHADAGRCPSSQASAPSSEWQRSSQPQATTPVVAQPPHARRLPGRIVIEH